MKIHFKGILLFSISILFILLIFSSCGKKREGLLVGTWEYVWISKNDSNEVIVYSFSEGGNIERVSTTNGVSKTFTGTYELEKKAGKLFAKIKIDNFASWLNGKYRILHVDKDILIMQQVFDSDGNYAFYRFEFVRKN